MEASRSLFFDPTELNSYPCTSPHFDPTITSSARIRDILDRCFDFGTRDELICIDIDGGAAELNHVSLASLKREKEAGLKLPKLRFLDTFVYADSPLYAERLSEKYRSLDTYTANVSSPVRGPTNLTKTGFIEFLDLYHIPPSFLEVLADNNGAYFRKKCLKNGRGYEIYCKIPHAPHIEGTLFLRHTSDGSTVILWFDFTNIYEKVFSRLMHIYPASMSPSFEPADRDAPVPSLLIPSIIISELGAALESTRAELDDKTVEFELSTGLAPVFPKRRGLKITISPANQTIQVPDRSVFVHDLDEYTRELHLLGASLMFFEVSATFLKSFTGFLLAQKDALSDTDSVTESLDMIYSLSEHRVEQAKRLIRRVDIQISLTRSLTSQRDSRTATSIAYETKRDSSAMKSIAAVTMIFLPPTFVAALFDAPFFSHSGDNSSGIGVDRLWWVYFAVTVPLSVVVIGLWLYHLKQQEERASKESSSPIFRRQESTYGIS